MTKTISSPIGESSSAYATSSSDALPARAASAAAEALAVELRDGSLAQPLFEIGHWSTSLRSRRRPALTFCRAASSLIPIRSPTSR